MNFYEKDQKRPKMIIFFYKMFIFDQYLPRWTFLMENFHHFNFLTVYYLDIKLKIWWRDLKKFISVNIGQK